MFLKEIWRYPVKGLSGERLESVALEANSYFPQDRLWAIENGESGFNPAAPEHLSKTNFTMLMRHAKLALLKTKVKGEILHIEFNGEKLAANLNTAQGKALIESFIKEFLGNEVSHLRVLQAPQGFRFTDSRRGFVSLINLETIRALEKETGKEIDPVRFRGNLLIDNLPAFAENDLVNFRLQIGDCFFKVLKRTERCAATVVNPLNGARDIFIPAILNRTYGHSDCGVYLETVQGGEIEQGMRLKIHEPPQMNLPFA